MKTKVSYLGGMKVYDEQLEESRKAFLESEVIKTMLDPAIDAKFAELFVLQWTALNARFVSKTADYLLTAGNNSCQMGLKGVGEYLIKHSAEETGHEDWAVSDTIKLIKNWNRRYRDHRLSSFELINQQTSSAVERYHQLHKDIIFEKGAPFAELAIGLEIERITRVFGPLMLKQCFRKMGVRVLWEMSFLVEHIRFDFGHVVHDEEILGQFMLDHPQHREAVIQTGREALSVYEEFLVDCFGFAETVSQTA